MITDKTRNKLVKGYDSYMYMFSESHTFTNLVIMYIRNYIHVYNELYIICKACNNNLFNSVLLSTLVERSRRLNAIMQSPLLLRSFEHSAVWRSAHDHMCWLCCIVPRALGETKFTCINPIQLPKWMCTKLHWWGVERRNMHVSRFFYNASSLRCCRALSSRLNTLALWHSALWEQVHVYNMWICTTLHCWGVEQPKTC